MDIELRNDRIPRNPFDRQFLDMTCVVCGAISVQLPKIRKRTEMKMRSKKVTEGYNKLCSIDDTKYSRVFLYIFLRICDGCGICALRLC